MKRRVVITGLGPVSPIGIGKEAFWESACAGRGSFHEMDFGEWDGEQFRCRICSSIDNFNPAETLGFPKKLRRAAKATQYALLGAFLALEDAGFTLQEVSCDGEPGPMVYRTEGLDPGKSGVILGQSVNNCDVMMPQHTSFVRNRGPKKVHPFTLPSSNSNMGAAAVAEWFYLKGTNLTVSTACSSGAHAIGVAALNIQMGIEDIIVTGGTDHTLEPYFFCGFDVINALSTRNDDPMTASRPFDRDRDGFVLGEGAGVIVLEELEHAKKRGARIYGELAGYGYSADAYNIVAPDPYGRAAVAAVRKALEMGGALPEEVEYINAHGTSTLLNDPNESYIIKQVFGDYAYKVPVSSSKSFLGHPIGAAAGLEAIISLLTITRSVITPTANLMNPDVEYVDKAAPHLDKRCDLDYVSEGMREQSVGLVLSQSFGFGGQNGVLLFKRFED